MKVCHLVMSILKETILSMLLGLLRQLGFQISWSKVEGLTQQITFLGIAINTVRMSLALPPNTLQALEALLLEFHSRKRASKCQLQSLAGKLNYWQIKSYTQVGLIFAVFWTSPMRLSNHPTKQDLPGSSRQISTGGLPSCVPLMALYPACRQTKCSP